MLGWCHVAGTEPGGGALDWVKYRHPEFGMAFTQRHVDIGINQIGDAVTVDIGDCAYAPRQIHVGGPGEASFAVCKVEGHVFLRVAAVRGYGWITSASD